MPGRQGSESKTCVFLHFGREVSVWRDGASDAARTQLPGVPRRAARPGTRGVLRPRFLFQNHHAEGQLCCRRVPPARKEGAAPHLDRLARRGPRPGWSRIPPAAAPRGPGRVTLSPLHPREAGAVLPVPPPLSAPTRRGPRSHEERSRGTAVERRSRDPACSNRTGPRVGNGEEGRQGAAENPNIGSPPPPGGTVPPPLPARDQLPSCSHRKNPSRPCRSAETRRSAPGFPRPGPAIPQLRTPPYPDAALRSSLAAGTSPASAQSPARRVRLLPPLGFKLKFPGWGRQRTSAPAPPPRGGSSSRIPAGRAPGAETPRATTRPLRPGHAPPPSPLVRPTLSAGLAARGRRVPSAERTRLALGATLDNDC